MKSMQRKFGGLMKRSENQEDVQVVLTEFKTVNDSLERVRPPFTPSPKHKQLAQESNPPN